MTEMRYVNFDFLIAGMIETSASLRQGMTKKNPSIFYTKTKATTNLASLLVGNSRLNEFLRWSGIVAYSESQITLSIKQSC